MIELLKNLEENNVNNIVVKWEMIGFLTNVKNKRNVALACDLTAFYLIKNNYYGSITTLSHPVIVRIFRNIEEDLPNELIMDNVIEIISLLIMKIKEKEIEINDLLSSENLKNDVVSFCDNFPFNFGSVRE